MENENLENKFAMHLSGVLKGMRFEEGTNLLKALPCAYSDPHCYVEELDSAYGYKFRSECDVSFDGVEEYGICLIYFQFDANATHDEMIDLLEEYDLYDEEWSEDELTGAFWNLFNHICEELGYDELMEKFEDVKIYWDVSIGDGIYYYRDGDTKVYQ